MRTAPRATNGREFCPVPQMIGTGPIRIIPPPLTPLRLEIDPNVISMMPTKIKANAAKNSQLPRVNGVAVMSEVPVDIG